MQEIQKAHPFDTQIISGLEKWILKQCRLVFKNDDASKRPIENVLNNKIKDNDIRKHFKTHTNKTKIIKRKQPNTTTMNIQGRKTLRYQINISTNDSF